MLVIIYDRTCLSITFLIIFSLVNFIIRIDSHFDTICSFVEPFLTTYSTEAAGFGNDEIHSNNKKRTRPVDLVPHHLYYFETCAVKSANNLAPNPVADLA